MNRQSDGAALIGDGAGDRLADPPGGVGGEFVALLVIELLSCTDQAEGTLLDQVLEAQAPVHVLLGDRHHQPQVRLNHLFLGPTAEHQAATELDQRHVHQHRPLLGVGIVAVIRLELSGQLLELQQISDLAGQFDLLIRAEQANAADLLQIDADRVFGVDTLGAHLDAGQGLGCLGILLGLGLGCSIAVLSVPGGSEQLIGRSIEIRRRLRCGLLGGCGSGTLRRTGCCSRCLGGCCLGGAGLGLAGLGGTHLVGGTGGIGDARGLATLKRDSVGHGRLGLAAARSRFGDLDGFTRGIGHHQDLRARFLGLGGGGRAHRERDRGEEGSGRERDDGVSVTAELVLS